MHSLFIAYENDQWCRFVVHTGLQHFFHFTACVLFLSILLFFKIFFMSSITCGDIEVQLLQPYLVINVNVLVEPTEADSFWEKFELHLTSTCLLELLTAEYLRETNISSFISHLWLFLL